MVSMRCTLEAVLLVRISPRADIVRIAADCVAHIAAEEDFFLTKLAGQQSALPESWKDKFLGGSAVTDDRVDYPSRDELFRVLAERREANKLWLSSLSDEELNEPITGGLEMFAPTRAHMAGSLAMHEGVHAGQVSAARRAMGLPPTF